jgi:ABC-type multidrug transport system permease subunit
LSYLLSRLVMLVVEVGTILLFGTLVFGVPLRGSLVLLAALCVVGALAFGSIGLLISTRARTIEAVSGLMNFVMLPMWVLSGVFFSSQRFPDAVQPAIKALPLTALIDGLRANMLQGAGLLQLAPQFGILGAWLLVCFAVALKLFRWR